ncbi:MAG: aminotransferase class III-fold pyridoxal phosphate-dependent enzyme, partial [Novosphingobium sp.]|nr:aminotransferase class III-fold pyridoxal phosphate-dependent enzyme [Novosphingobium sp.]
FFHSSSSTANPIACAAALANLAIWREEPVADRIAALGRRQADRLAALAQRADIRNPRRSGTITAFEIAGSGGYLDEAAPRLMRFFRERDVLLRPLGNTLYVMPPYCIDDADLDRIYDLIEEAIARA